MKFGFTDETFNRQYAPLGMLLALYQQKQVLQPLEDVTAAPQLNVINLPIVERERASPRSNCIGGPSFGSFQLPFCPLYFRFGHFKVRIEDLRAASRKETQAFRKGTGFAFERW